MPFARVRNELSWWGDVCVSRGLCTVVPSSLRAHVLSMAHEGHLGIVKFNYRCRDLVWWPGIEQDIEGLLFVPHSSIPRQTVGLKGLIRALRMGFGHIWSRGTHFKWHLIKPCCTTGLASTAPLKLHLLCSCSAGRWNCP